MLSPADADLVHHDSGLPGLAVCLDSEALVATIAPLLPGCQLVPGRIGYVRYKPGQQCLVSHVLTCDGAPLTVSATAIAPGSNEQLVKARQWANDHGITGPWPIIVPELALMVFAFPIDTGLNGLPLLQEASSRQRFLEKLLPTYPELWNANVVAVRYKPQRRFVARLETAGQTRAVLKLYTRSGFPTAEVNAKAFHLRPNVRIPQRLGRSNRHHALALEWLPGQLLLDRLGAPDFDVEVMMRVGQALAELHGQRASRLQIRSRADEIDALDPTVRWLGHVCPDLAQSARQLYFRIAGKLQCLSLADAAVHGDFYSKQVLVNHEAVAIIDFDEAFRGHSAYDLGMFIAHLIRDQLRGLVPGHLVEPVRSALLAGYVSSGRDLDEAAVSLYTAVGLLRLAPHPFRNREPEWQQATAEMLNLAERQLESHRRESRRTVVCS